MHFYQDRNASDLEEELNVALTELQRRLLYAGNVLTFLNKKPGNLLESFFAKASREVKILLMHPYSLFGRDRMAAESYRIPTERQLGRAVQTFNEFNCGATYSTLQAHWIPDQLSTTLKRLLGTFNFSASDIRLSVLNPLCSALICDTKAFLTPYHYGRKTEEAECTAQNSPVIVMEENDPPLDALLNHVNYLWTQPTAYSLEHCVDSYDDPARLRVKRPEELQFLKNIRQTGDSWLDLGLIAEQVAKIYCPKENLKLRRAVFFSHPGERLNEVQELKRLLETEFYAEGYALLDEDHAGEIVYSTLEERIRRCSHAIVLASRDRKTNSKYPNANVLHELGWCQALLGANHVLVLRFPDTSLPSNIGGVIYSNYQGQLSDIEKVRNWLKSLGFQTR